MTTYAAWDERTDTLLRDQSDDTYIRPLFSILPDDSYDYDPEHSSCPICQTEHIGPRWVPHNGGAWVDSNSWAKSGYAVEEYLKWCAKYDIS